MIEPLLRRSWDEDDWGYAPGFADALRPWTDVLYDRWWRVRAEGVEHVPASGRCLVVANHAGLLPWDALMMATAIRRAHDRAARFLVDDRAFELPFTSVAVRRLGGVPSSPYNALGLLEDDHAVLVFPEGPRAAAKPYKDRYRVERFGRGGFVELALRARAPVVPCAVVGSEEVYPKLGELPLLGRLVGASKLPITPTFPWLGPLGAVPLPSRWRLAFGPPIDLSDHPPEAAEDRALVLELSDLVRDRVQTGVLEELTKRRGAFI